uniref:Uncharacterized protein n=1 Tax=Sporolithon durum TaxID=48970 RepID=A0A141SD42_9FLOR|nr:hypothetical protein Sdur_172 [Sporolithon durum]AMK96210.1 hypothetical protein Sdur_172 [Sporolithon durum]
MPVPFIKVHFHYYVPDRDKSVLTFVLKTNGMTSNIPLEPFKQSILTNLVAPFIMLQSTRVVWKTFSVTYPTKKNRRYDYYSIPLNNVCGQMRVHNYQYEPLSIQLRFKNRPRPKSIKIYGFSSFEMRNTKEVERNLKRCEAAFLESFSVENTDMTYQAVICDSKVNKNINDRNCIAPVRALVMF